MTSLVTGGKLPTTTTPFKIHTATVGDLLDDFFILLGFKSNFDKTAASTSTMRPPLHTAHCSLLFSHAHRSKR